MSVLRNIVCWVMAVLLALPGFAADSGAAMLYVKGTAWVNGSEMPDSSAVFPGDLVRTKADSMANLNAFGSNVMIGGDSLVKLQGNGISLQQGSVNVVTAKGLSTRSGGVVVAPAAATSSQYEMTNDSGALRIIAQKGDLTITDGTQVSTLSQGQETTVSDTAAKKTEKKRREAGALPGARGPWLSTHAAIIIGTALAGGLLTWVLIQGDDPMSQASPQKAAGVDKKP